MALGVLRGASSPQLAAGCASLRAGRRAAVARPTGGASQPVTAHYRFPDPVDKGQRLTGSKSKKVIRIWQAEVASQEAPRVRDELLLLLRLHPAGLLLDEVWPAVRAMVRGRAGAYSPVTAGHLDKPDRTMAGILVRAGFASLKAFLAAQPEVELQGEGTRVSVSLTPAYLASQTRRPQQPRAGEPDSPSRVVLRTPRVREISAQLLGVPDWRLAAAERGRERQAAVAAAQKLLAAAEEQSAQCEAREEPQGDALTPRTGLGQQRFPAWRRVRPPRAQTPQRSPAQAQAPQ